MEYTVNCMEYTQLAPRRQQFDVAGTSHANNNNNNNNKNTSKLTKVFFLNAISVHHFGGDEKPAL